MSKQKNLATCTCCNTPRHRTEAQTAISQLRKLFPRKPAHKEESDAEIFGYFSADHYRWACNPCLTSDRAIKADTSKQNFRGNPRFAYWGTEHTCTNCQQSFLFRKTEQQFWYENLQFFIDAEPVACPECRKTIRHQKNENQELSDLLRSGEKDLSEAKLERIIAIYRQWKMEEKAKYFSGILKRRKR